MWYIWTSDHNAHSVRWVKAFKAGKFSVDDDTCPGRPKTSVTKANIAAVKIVVEHDARLSVKDIASCTGISEGSVKTKKEVREKSRECQSQTAALPRPQEEEETDKSKQAQFEQTYEKH